MRSGFISLDNLLAFVQLNCDRSEIGVGMKTSQIVKAICLDSHFLVPLSALLIGLTLLITLH